MSDKLALATTSTDLKRYLDQTGCRQAIENALPHHLKADRMVRLALTCFSTTPKLRNCTAQSILASIVVASQLGLEPGINGQGYLIPYKNTCTFVPGWQGLVGLLNNSGRATAWTGAVFEGDEWEFSLGSNPRIHHAPGDNYGDVDCLKWVYACGQVNGAQMPVIEAWPMKRVWKHRDKFNKVGAAHYSYEHPEMYARKVVLLQVLKYMPRSVELQNAIVAAESLDNNKTTVVDGGMVIEADPTDINADPEETKVISQGEAKSAAPAMSPQEELALIVGGAGVSFDEFRTCVSDAGMLKNADSIGSWAEIPKDDAERLLRGRKVLVATLVAMKGK